MKQKQPTPPKASTKQLEDELPVELAAAVPEKKSPKKSSSTKSDNATKANEEQTLLKKNKIAKEKVIRDSFSFPEHDYLKISELKQICLAEGIHIKKGELLRAGLLLLATLSLDELKQAIGQVEKVKTGRPNSTKK